MIRLSAVQIVRAYDAAERIHKGILEELKAEAEGRAAADKATEERWHAHKHPGNPLPMPKNTREVVLDARRGDVLVVRFLINKLAKTEVLAVVNTVPAELPADG